MKTRVIYHRADFDGLFCREIAKRFLPEAELVGWDYGDAEPKINPNDPLYILDLSVHGLMAHPKLVWIDHHKSAIDKYSASIPGYRIDGVAACRLAWQWFLLMEAWDPREQHPPGELPTKQEFVDRRVDEPPAVRLAGEYDIWDKRDSDAQLFQHGLRSVDLSGYWPNLLRDDAETLATLLERGEAVAFVAEQQNASIIHDYGFTRKWEGLNFLCCNHARFNSHLFTAGILPEHDALLGFNWSGTDWRVSLYGIDGRPEIDLSVIAVKYGGGGHRGACGFRVKELPFLAP